jgi:hypothetical protein
MKSGQIQKLPTGRIRQASDSIRLTSITASARISPTEADVLKSIDVLIGLAVVMLVLSAAVTTITQFVLHIRQSKGKTLKVGIADLLQLIAPDVQRQCAERISDAVLKHPLVCRGDGKLSETIHREELVKILLELSTATGTYKLEEADRKALQDALEANGVKDPATVLANARMLLLQLEKSHPQLSNAMRTDLALLQEAESSFLAKIHSWFDQTIDRTVDRFTITARKVTFCCAAGVVMFLQLDTIALINQLSMDGQLRNTLVQQAMGVNTTQPTAAPATTPQDMPAAAKQLRADLDANRDQIQDLATLGLFRVPQNVGEWAKEFQSGNIIMKISGLLVSMVLLSLGAPFWYNALKTLIGLRSVIADKDDVQRAQRQTQPAKTDAPAAGTGTPPDTAGP